MRFSSARVESAQSIAHKRVAEAVGGGSELVAHCCIEARVVAVEEEARRAGPKIGGQVAAQDCGQVLGENYVLVFGLDNAATLEEEAIVVPVRVERGENERDAVVLAQK